EVAMVRGGHRPLLMRHLVARRKFAVAGLARCATPRTVSTGTALILRRSAYMPRAMWKGRLEISLVSCGVKLYSALSAAEQVHFHMLNRKTNNRIKLVQHDIETGEEVARADLVKGFEFEKGRYVVVQPEEVDKLRPARDKTI